VVPLDADARDLACELALAPTARDPTELGTVGALDVVRVELDVAVVEALVATEFDHREGGWSPRRCWSPTARP